MQALPILKRSNHLLHAFISELLVKCAPCYPNQEDINDLIRDLSLTKSNAEQLLISRLKQWDLIDDNVRINSQRKRHCGFTMFNTFKDRLCCCHDIQGFFQAKRIPCNHSEWRLFIGSSSRSLKDVLLRNTTSVPPFLWLIQFT